MIFEHEIPNGSRLYFGENAKKKRILENKISSFLEKNNFEEIVTPNFSYSQHQSIDNETQLIKISDENNNQVALRADSTLDVARIITKRLGRTTNHKKWFYIQPIFTYPSNEYYQIGLEWLEYDNIVDIINLSSEIFKILEIQPLVQITNINIAQTVAKELNLDIDIFKNTELSKLFELKIQWLDKLLYASSANDLEQILDILPNSITTEVKKLIDISNGIKYDNITISPLYYTAMKYYEDLYFKVIDGNYTIAKGGRYTSDGVSSMGFAFYTDNLLKILEN